MDTLSEKSDLSPWLRLGKELNKGHSEELEKGIQQAILANPWFTYEHIHTAIKAIGENLQEEKLQDWLSAYPSLEKRTPDPKTIAVVMAGNIPLVGFHDFLCVLLSGHRILAKLSKDDAVLLPLLSSLLTLYDPEMGKRITFTTEPIRNFYAVIATGSNNSARYFEYYFGTYPHIIRKNRNSIAILNGKETEQELMGLVDDIFLYFGLGCRNVSKLLVPEHYDFSHLISLFNRYKHFNVHHKYQSSYTYFKALYGMSSVECRDTGNLLLVRNAELSTPVGLLSYSTYTKEDEYFDFIHRYAGQIQCICSSIKALSTAIPLGTAQKPGLSDYADQVDTLDFLLGQ